VKELDLKVSSKDREMELLEDNHRVELRVYQQKVKHLEYEHRNNIKDIKSDGQRSIEREEEAHDEREKDMLQVKERLKMQKMGLDLVNEQKVAEIRSTHEKSLAKMRQGFEESLRELTERCEQRLRNLDDDMELRRRVEVHEVEERKNQHINDLISNHNKAFGQMKEYYNKITATNLKVIKDLKRQIEDLRNRLVNNKRILQEYENENNFTLKPKSESFKERLAKVQEDLRERAKDQMALRNARSRLSALGKALKVLKVKYSQLEDEYNRVDQEKDELYNSFEESILKVQQQSDFNNQALEQKLKVVEANAEKTSTQVEEIIRAANLDGIEMARVMTSLNQVLAAKDDALKEYRFVSVKLKKSFNDSLDTFKAKMRELGLPEEEIAHLGMELEILPPASTSAPAGLVH
jgi:hypothetical protein